MEGVLSNDTKGTYIEFSHFVSHFASDWIVSGDDLICDNKLRSIGECFLAEDIPTAYRGIIIEFFEKNYSLNGIMFNCVVSDSVCKKEIKKEGWL